MPAPRSQKRMSDAAVAARTGKTWPAWFRLMDKGGCTKLDHKAIVAWLSQHHPKLGGWWTQMVTVTYEQERGLRDKHQKADGYSVSGSRTLAVPAEALFDAWLDEVTRRRWLGKAPLAIRTATPHKSIRCAWEGGRSRVDINLYDKGDGKCQITVQHHRLPDAASAERMKQWWADRLDRLVDRVTPPPASPEMAGEAGQGRPAGRRAAPPARRTARPAARH